MQAFLEEHDLRSGNYEDQEDFLEEQEDEEEVQEEQEDQEEPHMQAREGLPWRCKMLIPQAL